MKNYVALTLLFVFILPSCRLTSDTLSIEDCQQSITHIREIQNEVEKQRQQHTFFWKELYVGGPRKTDWFDVNKFFSALPHTQVQDGYTIDYIQFPGTNGWPILYARKIGGFPYSSFDEIQAERIKVIDEIYNSPGTLDDHQKAYQEYRYQYMNFIQTDGSKQGFLELITFRILGDQFYLIWHSNYHDEIPVCNANHLKQIINGEIVEEGLDPEPLHTLIEATRNINLSPSVEFQDEVVAVRLFFFTKFGGLMRSEIIMQRDFPHFVIREGSVQDRK